MIVLQVLGVIFALILFGFIAWYFTSDLSYSPRALLLQEALEAKLAQLKAENAAAKQRERLANTDIPVDVASNIAILRIEGQNTVAAITAEANKLVATTVAEGRNQSRYKKLDRTTHLAVIELEGRIKVLLAEAEARIKLETERGNAEKVLEFTRKRFELKQELDKLGRVQ